MHGALLWLDAFACHAQKIEALDGSIGEKSITAAKEENRKSHQKLRGRKVHVDLARSLSTAG